jgi:hypothetical protein
MRIQLTVNLESQLTMLSLSKPMLVESTLMVIYNSPRLANSIPTLYVSSVSVEYWAGTSLLNIVPRKCGAFVVLVAGRDSLPTEFSLECLQCCCPSTLFT